MNAETERCKVCGAPLFCTAIFSPVTLKMLIFAGKYETEYENIEIRQWMLRNGDLTQGGITSTSLRFILSMTAGSLLQQRYNIADTFIVGQCIGSGVLVAVGSAYTLMIFLISILLGLSIGSGTVFLLRYGAGDWSALWRSIFVSLVLIGAVTFLLNVAALICLDPILHLFQVPQGIYGMIRSYLWIIFCGIALTFIYNFYVALLRAVGDSVAPLRFLAVPVVLNIILGLFFILQLDWRIEGIAAVTVIAQGVAAVGVLLCTGKKRPGLQLRRKDMRFDRRSPKEIVSFSALTCVQQSVMNFSILMIQGLVNSFGMAAMAAPVAAAKIDSFAYMPMQEFGNTFPTSIAQDFGAKRYDRIHRGVRSAFLITVTLSLIVSMLVFVFVEPLMLVFVHPEGVEVFATGVEYPRAEGTFYRGIGILFLLYGYYRVIRMPGMSVVLTVISLGTRVVLSYVLASIPSIGVTGIWWSIPIGWLLADAVDMPYYKYCALRAA